MASGSVAPEADEHLQRAGRLLDRALAGRTERALSKAEEFSLLEQAERDLVLNGYSRRQREQLEFDWRFWGRPTQFAPTDRAWDNWLILAGRGFGKALALDTRIPTPSGWTTMEAIRAGDRAFDECGQVCKVVAVHTVMIGRSCYRVRFSDGTEIVADGEHLWTTIDRKTRKALGRRVVGALSNKPQCQPRYAPRTVTTAEIAATLYDGNEVNHCIPCTNAMRLPEAKLPIDPYLLGCWLGDGSSRGAEITSADSEIVEAFKSAGYRLAPYSKSGNATVYGIGEKVVEYRRDATTGRYNAGTRGFRFELASLGLLGNKHIPARYLRASAAQRRALLQGLFDTDGFCDSRTGASEFCSINERLANEARELALSLGYKAVRYVGRATLNGRDCGPKYRVCFMAHNDAPLFRLRRKLRNQPNRGAQAERAYRRYIVAVEATKSVPVRCITVDSPSQLYLAGDAMVPTHNTRTGAEWVRVNMCGRSPLARGRWRHIALIAETAADARDVMVGDGKTTSDPTAGSGLLQVHPKDFRPIYEPSKRRLTWPNGATASIYNGTEPDQLRGPQHSAAWCDELAKWRYAQEAWDQLQFGMRTGENPQVCITTTPRPILLLKEILKDIGTVVTSGSTFDNAGNLSPKFLALIKRKYENTRLGRQELYAELLEDVEGALWKRSVIDSLRVKLQDVPPIERIVVAIDPPASSNEDSNECGIICAGLGVDKHAYVLDDVSAVMAPAQWGAEAISLYRARAADRIIAEVNNGGDMVENTIRMLDQQISFGRVWASRGKWIRAEPVSALYEQGRVHHVGTFARLEDQMCAMTVDFNRNDMGYSPDRMDALVWALTELMVEGGGSRLLIA